MTKIRMCAACAVAGRRMDAHRGDGKGDTHGHFAVFEQSG